MSYATFLADKIAVAERGEWWLELDLLDPNDALVTLRYSRRGTPSPSNDIFYEYGHTTTPFEVLTYQIPADTPFYKRIATAPSITLSVWNNNRIGGEVVPNYGDVSLVNADGGLDPYHPDNGYTWAGQEWRLFYLDSADPANTIGIVGVGRMDAPQYSLSDVKLNLLGFESAFDIPLSERVYRGTSYMLELDAGNNNAKVNYLQPAKLNQRGSFTAMGWVWWEALPTAATTTILYGPTGASTGRPWLVTVNSSGQIRVGRSIGGAIEVFTTTMSMSVHNWYHVAVVVDSRTVTVYLFDETLWSQTIETSVNFFSNATADALANDVYNQASNASKFWLDEWSLDNVALSEDEITAARHAPQTDLRSTCVHRVGFDDGAGTTPVTDSTSSPANGTISVAGTGTYTWFWAMEGDDSLAGKSKPDGWGRFFHGAPVLIDNTRQVYQLTGDPSNTVSSFGSIREGGVLITQDSNSASYRAFLVTAHTAGSVAGGHAQPYTGRGLFKLGTAPTKPIGASGIFTIDTPAAMMIDIALKRAGWDMTNWDDGQADIIEAAYPYQIGYWTDNPQQVSIADLFSKITQSLGLGYWGFARGSRQLRINVFTGPGVSSDFDWTEREIIDIQETNTQRTVTYEVVVSYFHNYLKLDNSSIAASILLGANSDRRTLREDNFRRTTDRAVRAKFPGKASISQPWPTLLFNTTDAQLVADDVMAVLGGAHSGYRLVLRQPAREAQPDDVASLSVTQQGVGTRLNQDGTKLYNILTIKDRRQDGVLEAEVWK